MTRSVVCPYCNRPAMLVSGTHIYPHRADLHERRYWRCDPCQAHVGTHRDSDAEPLGRLANADLRQAKTKAHEAFDDLWRSGRMKRRQAYRWLAQQLQIDEKDCHIGMFDVQQCRAVVEAVRRRTRE